MFDDWSKIQLYILQLETEGKVTRTFRRLDPERQRAVVLAILDEAAEKGPTALKIKEVAQRADVSVGSLYQYFDNRDALLDFAVSFCVRYAADMFVQYGPMLADFPLREALQYYLLGGVEWGQTQTGMVRFFGRAAYHGDPDLAESLVQPIAKIMLVSVQRILHEAAARGEIRPEVDLKATGRVLNTLMLAVGDAQLFPHLNDYFQLSDEGLPTERVVDALLDMVMKGIT